MNFEHFIWISWPFDMHGGFQTHELDCKGNLLRTTKIRCWARNRSLPIPTSKKEKIKQKTWLTELDAIEELWHATWTGCRLQVVRICSNPPAPYFLKIKQCSHSTRFSATTKTQQHHNIFDFNLLVQTWRLDPRWTCCVESNFVVEDTRFLHLDFKK